MAEKAVAPQQPVISVRISDALRARLERLKELLSLKNGESVSTSEVAKQLLESAREDRLEVAELLSDATKSLAQARRKIEAGYSLSRSEWIVVAYFAQQGTERYSNLAPTYPVSGETVKGKSMSVSRMFRPGKRNLAMAHAAATPNTVFSGTAIAAVMSVSLMAAAVSGWVRAAISLTHAMRALCLVGALSRPAMAEAVMSHSPLAAALFGAGADCSGHRCPTLMPTARTG